MKRIISFVLALVMLFVFAGCTTSEEPNDNANKNTVNTEQENTQKIPEVSKAPLPEPVVLESDGDLGDYHVAIHEFEMVKDYEGKPAIIISYTFTNNYEEATSAMFSVSDSAYQNGVQLETAIIADDSVLNVEDNLKDIKTGASIDLKSAFLLNSDTAPVIYEMCESISFDDSKIGKTFEISDGGETVLSQAPAGEISADLGDYNVSIVSYEIGKDYEGNKAIILHYGFTNNSDSAAAFWTTLDCSLFQDGVELESAILGDGFSTESQTKKVLTGAGIEVVEGYLLTSESAVEIEISEYFSFSDDKLIATINLA